METTQNFIWDIFVAERLLQPLLELAVAFPAVIAVLVLAVATLYLTVQGTAVVASGKRRWVDPHWFRGHSYLKWGWNWVKAALTKGWQLFQPSSLISHVDPVPAMASRKQREQNRYRLEFTARMINYAR